jgi:hypothetical protein
VKADAEQSDLDKKLSVTLKEKAAQAVTKAMNEAKSLIKEIMANDEGFIHEFDFTKINPDIVFELNISQLATIGNESLLV